MTTNSQRGGRDAEAAPYFGLFAAFVAALSVAAYAGYVVYPRFNLPPLEGLALFVLAAAAGIASFFSPCAFPLLVTLIAPPASADEGRSEMPAALSSALALSAGAVAFLALVGTGLALGGAALFARVTFTSTAGIVLRTAVGLLLIALGLVQSGRLSRRPFDRISDLARPLGRLYLRLRQRTPLAGQMAYGFGYLLAGFG